jgi:tetrapyrrole methylase family protein/MazG family protein
MIDFISKDRYGFDDLVRLVELLRAPGGCPWDAAQTHLSIRRNFLEEAYEACEGFDRDDPALMCEELGDVLLQVLFHTDIERAAGRFTLDDVCDGICKKLIFRHPFLFGSEAAGSWDEIKQQEKGQTTTGETLDAVARSLPALWRSEKLQKKAAKTGFVWESPEEALDKLEGETAELREAIREHTNAEEELGDVLFAAVSVAAQLQADPEEALHGTCEKFIRRFSAMEQTAAKSGRPLETMNREELLRAWNAQKPAGEATTESTNNDMERGTNHEQN